MWRSRERNGRRGTQEDTTFVEETESADSWRLYYLTPTDLKKDAGMLIFPKGLAFLRQKCQGGAGERGEWRAKKGKHDPTQ